MTNITPRNGADLARQKSRWISPGDSVNGPASHHHSDYGDDSSGTSALEREIDQLVYALYSLTPEEIKIVEGGTTN